MGSSLDGRARGEPGAPSYAGVRTFLGRLALALSMLVLGACTAIIDGELSGKPGQAGATGGAGSGSVASSTTAASSSHASSSGTGGQDAGKPACQHDADCASTPAKPVCNVSSGICVQCLPTSNSCAVGEKCTPSWMCAPGCVAPDTCPPYAGASAACSNGACELGPCDPGFADCDGVPGNGCEVELSKDPSDCGTCGNLCSLLDAHTTCTAGKCVIVSCNAGSFDCDGMAANGCEVDLLTDVDNCGGCGTLCSLQHATAICVGGKCAIGACAAGYADCDSDAKNGCEVSKNADVNNCGTCNNSCSLFEASATCENGFCLVDTCNVGFADCDGLPTNGCETNLKTDQFNCGACHLACSTNNAMPQCTSGVCSLVCSTGFQNCDGNVANGCEAHTTSSVANCGACGNVCPASGGTPTCSSSNCGSTPCMAGLGTCGSTLCGTPITTVANCGGCGVVCSAPNGTPGCSGTACVISSCNGGWADCNGAPVDGCEVNTANDLANCGGCGQACSLPNANPACVAGACTLTSCAHYFANCDNSVSNGCEVDTRVNLANCGGCGVACSAKNGTPTCIAGTCSIVCQTGFANCDSSVATGCETNLNTDPAHCGGCSTACLPPHATPGCSNGKCTIASCAAPFADCDNLAANGCETDTSSSPTNCGGCGKACNGQNGTPTCAGSACGIVCSAGFQNCDMDLSNGCEVALGTDVNNCGFCGVACPRTNGTPSCVGGVCGYASCATGRGSCGGALCSTNLMNDSANCGACGTVCSVAHGTGACMNGVCAVTQCNAGFGNCDHLYGNGCESALVTNTNCGACGVSCSLPNAKTSCATGTCALSSCTGTYADCDQDPSNGCETEVGSNVADCGGCNHACSTVNATPSCVNSACVLACTAGFGDCDQNVGNGCETNTTTDPLNCGACGRVCAATNVASIDCTASTCDSTCAVGFGNCMMPAAPMPDDGCESNVNANPTACGSCANSCSAQGPPASPLVCSPTPATANLCGCSADANCNLGGAGGTCAPSGLCVCNNQTCNEGEVCMSLSPDVCSCNGLTACASTETCCKAGCVDLTKTATSCGACGQACPPGFSCQASQCACTMDAQCGAGGTCVMASGTCQCGASSCTVGQRCLTGGSCG